MSEAPAQIRGLTLDTGALLALEHGSGRIRRLFHWAEQLKVPLWIPAGVLVQAWRGSSRQAVVAKLLADRRTTVAPLDELTARAIGQLCGQSGHHNVVDVSVVLCARQRGHAVVTSDPKDIAAVDPSLRLIEP
ncbi:MAG TPA: hypothetical protein VLJ59_18455 [Mycobacteriales bacterium]|nr:hypothetical protein [Mycobacteriales bacterium]